MKNLNYWETIFFSLSQVFLEIT